jgi:hypothetical protein
MSDVIDLGWIGAQLRAIQAEQRTLRSENEILRTTILNSLGEVVRVLSDRIGNFEALSEARMDQFAHRVAEQLDRIEASLRPRTTPP